MSSPGNESPASRTRTRSPNSRQAMLRPTSPTPPRKTSLQGAGILQRLSDLLDLLFAGGDQGEARRAHGLPEKAECGFYGHGIRGEEHPVESREKLLVNLACGGHITARGKVDHLTDPLPHHVRCDRDGPHRTETDESKRGPIVSAIHVETRRRCGDDVGEGIEVSSRVLDGQDVLDGGQPK